MKSHALLRSLCSVLLTLSLLLPVFAFAAEDTPKGGYIEAILDLPEGYTEHSAVAAAPDGRFSMVARVGETSEFHLLTWVNQTAEPDAYPLASGGLNGLSYAPDGSLLGWRDIGMKVYEEAAKPTESTDAPEAPEASDGDYNLLSFDESSLKNTLFWLDEEGNALQSFEIPGYVRDLQALSGQRVAAIDGISGQLGLYDPQGALLHTLDAPSAFSLAANNDTLFAVNTLEVLTFSPDSGDLLSTRPVSMEADGNAFADADGTLYLLDSHGLRRLAPDAAEPENIYVFQGHLIGDPGNIVTGFSMLPGGALLCAVEEGGGDLGGGSMSFSFGSAMDSLLVSYTYSAELDLSNRKDFRITALRENGRLRKAANDFQRLHPELNVILKAQMAETFRGPEDASASPAEDHIRTMHTELLAGQGGDVLILDGLPVAKYIERGLLADLTEALSDIDFLPGIRAGSQSADGKLYAMPAQFRFEALWGNGDVVKNLTSQSALVNVPLAPDQSLLAPRTPEAWLRLLYPAAESAFQNELGQPDFASESFLSFLASTKALYDAQIGSPAEGNVSGAFSQADMEGIRTAATALYPAQSAGLGQTAIFYSLCGAGESDFVPIPSLSAPGFTYTPVQLAAVNSQSSLPAEAFEFLRLLYSPALQAIDQGDGLPALAPALDTLLQEQLEFSEQGGVMAFSTSAESEPLIVQQPDAEAWRHMLDVCAQLDQPYLPDETLLGFLVEETAPYFDGQITAEQAASALAQRAWPYLNE